MRPHLEILGRGFLGCKHVLATLGGFVHPLQGNKCHTRLLGHTQGDVAPRALGGEVGRMETPELGVAETTLSFFGSNDPLFTGLPWNHMMMHAHGCEVTKAPPGGTPIPLVSSKGSKVQAYRVGLTTYGFQYHFEWNKQRCLDIIDHNSKWIATIGTTADELKQGLEDHYDQYRHFGDRLCKLIADRLFPLDKRLPPTRQEVANFRR